MGTLDTSKISAQVARLELWARNTLLPLWLQPEVRTSIGLLCENLDHRGVPSPAAFHRTLVCARQAFFFLRMSGEFGSDLLRRGLDTLDQLIDLYADREHGGFVRSIGPDGAVHDGTKDLYTLAFVILACAEGHQHTRQGRYIEIADAILQDLSRSFRSSGTGGYHSLMSRDFSTALEPPAQNPHMHLFEAVSSLWETSRDSGHAEQLRALATTIDACFFDSGSDAILELPRHELSNWIEPGHQFEWFSLASERIDLLGETEFLAHIRQAYDAAKRQGLDPSGRLVPLKKDVGWRTLDASNRIWTQLELLRALAMEIGLDRTADGSLLSAALDGLFDSFLQEDRWNEVIAAGRVIRSEMPASTPYHFVGCLQELRRLAARDSSPS